MENEIVFPYIPNSTKNAKQKMMDSLGITSLEELYEAIPDSLRLNRSLDLPAPLLSELELEQHVMDLLNKNVSTSEAISFLGSGCYDHYVPATCDEINSRNEFLTVYSGKTYEDHGRYQALFEFQSMMSDLLNMDVVALPTYDGLQAAASALRMAVDITGKKKILLSKNISPEKISKIYDFLGHSVQILLIDFDQATGEVSLESLSRNLNRDVAAIFFDNPNFFGIIEKNGDEIASLAHKFGSLCVVSVDPISLGVLKSPADYGADIVCGDIQSLGMHIQGGGGQAGFIAVHDDPKFIMEIPLRIYGIVPTIVEGEYGFGEVAIERTSLMSREKGKEWVGTMANLWGITAAVYLATLGKKGMVEIGKLILSNTQYAYQAITSLPGIRARFSSNYIFREFVVDFSNSNHSVSEINNELLKKKIFGGYDLTNRIEGCDNCAVYCTTEIHSKQDIDYLVGSLKEVLQ